jgi:acyl carrier protein
MTSKEMAEPAPANDGQSERAAIAEEILQFIRDRFLDGQGSGLEPTTTLVECGVLDSFNFVILLAFIDERFGVSLDLGASTERFETVDAIASLILTSASSR